MRLPLLLTTALAVPAVLLTAAATLPANPKYGTYGFDTAGMDRSVQPGVDFYTYANGAWVKNNPVPADRSNFGAFHVLGDISQERTKELLEGVKGDPNSKIGITYSTYLDTATIEAKGLAPIKPWLDHIKALGDKAGYAKLAAEADRNGIGSPFGSFVGQDDKNPEVYTLFLFQGGIGMPDRDYYLTEGMAKTKAAYEAHLAKMLTLAGEANGAERAKAIVDFETEIAKVHWTQVDSRDATKSYNARTVAELTAEAPGFDFATYTKAIGAPVDKLVVSQPSALTGTARLLAAAPIEVLKDQLLVRSLDAFADVLPKAFDDENFAFFSTTLSGTPEQQARWKRAVDYTTGTVTDEVSKLYVAKYFPPETKKAADELVKNVIAGMGKRIDGLDWMTPETKKKARAKLAAFKARIGYPEQWKDYSAMKAVAGDAFGNNLRSNQWAHDYNIGKLGKPIRRWEWGLTPMDINAQANFQLVAITFPAAILQAPFFDPAADPAINYGAIGAVIGHEISHHFDDQGAKYNQEGRLADWWTPADVAAFQARTGALAKQYDAYEVLPGVHLNGEFTLGENVGDLGGLAAAYEGYKMSLKGKEAPVIDGTTGDQRFYLGWAQVWRRNYREANLRQRVITDPHSPSTQRTWMVRNLDPWYAAYAVKPGQAMFLTPEQRVRIW
jgi:putative endopeptidase